MRTIILGIDAFDPKTFEQLVEAGRLPNLVRFVGQDGYARFTVTNPPQSEVSWTSIATGLNPGGHGMFDFVHRIPESYSLYVSMLPTKQALTGATFASPYDANTIFDQAASKAYPATSLWWPATFPARPQFPIQSIPGLGTPDILGRLGVGTLFSTNPDGLPSSAKTQFVSLTKSGEMYSAKWPGPLNKKGGEVAPATIDLSIRPEGKDRAQVRIGKQTLILKTGEWSPVLELSFRMSLLFRMRAVSRVIVTQTEPYMTLYALPLQIHPLRSPWHYAAPPGWIKQIWQQHGPYLTLGWPQDTTGLEDGCMDDNHFLALCDAILAHREAVFMQQIDRFDEGVLACVFDSLDRIQHMFWRDHPEVIHHWYEKLDALVGRVESRLRANNLLPDTQFAIVSDHGFAAFDYKVHLNRWLLEKGYLANVADTGGQDFKSVDWAASRAYAIGLNSIYLNQQGREGEGIVSPGERTSNLEQLRAELLQWRGPDGRNVVEHVALGTEAFEGPYVDHGPDLVIGYAPGYRASAETGLGNWQGEAIEVNRDHWGADHCIASDTVPGVIFAARGLSNFPNPSYRDFPALTIGMMPDNTGTPPRAPRMTSQEDEKIVEERLKSLGYL